jgi:hypothetical protein
LWLQERSEGGLSNPRFQSCCGLGRYTLAPLFETNTEFKKNIRAYNNALSFVSLRVNLDTLVQNSRMGAYCFRIHGGLYHRIGSLLPEENESPKYAQIYIYDSSENSHQTQLSNRLSVVSHINRQTLDMLQSIMININPYITAFKNMKEFVDRNPELVSDVRFVLKAEGTPDPRRYNAPSDENEIAVLIYWEVEMKNLKAMNVAAVISF